MPLYVPLVIVVCVCVSVVVSMERVVWGMTNVSRVYPCISCLEYNDVHNSVLSRLFWGVLYPPIVQIYPLISDSEAAAPPIRMMACMQSQSVFNSNLYQTVIQIVK